MKRDLFYCPVCGMSHSITAFANRAKMAKSADSYLGCDCGTKLVVTLLEQEFIIKQAHIKLINC